MKMMMGIGAIVLCAGFAAGDIADNFDDYILGELPGGGWLDATSFIDEPTHTGNSVSVIQTTDAFGNATQAVQVVDHIGTSGGMMSRVDAASNQRFEIDVRLDQHGNGRNPNWMSAIGFVQETDQADFNWSPQAFVYTSNNGRFRLFVQNADGRGSASRDFALGSAVWSLDTWFHVSLEADTVNGIFDVTISNIATGDVLADVTRTYAGWDASFGQYYLVSVNDGEYGTSLGTVGNMATYDNASYVPAPGALGMVAFGGLCMARRRR